MNLKILASFVALLFILAFNIYSPTFFKTREVVLKEKFLDGKFPRLSSTTLFELERAFPNLTFGSSELTNIVSIPGSNQFVALGKDGKVWQFAADETSESAREILDISDEVLSTSEAGLLSMAFHPKFNDLNSEHAREVYLFYTFKINEEAPLYDRLSRFQFSENLDSILASSEEILIQQYDRDLTNNGGDLFFDKEGYLHVSLGDEGGTYDSYDNAQQINTTLFGGILRIDVDLDANRSHSIRRFPVATEGKPAGYPDNINQLYMIPNDNPWVSETDDYLEEYFAIGFRDPHRMYYDSLTDQIWVADVGHFSREEVSIITKGANAQWPYREGEYYRSSIPDPLTGIDTPPVLSYNRNNGTCIIGGFVYSGEKHNKLNHKYIYGDFGSGNIWALDPENSNEVTLLSEGPANLVSLFSNTDGDIFVLYLNGEIYRLVDKGIVDPPILLSETNAFSDLSNMTPAEGVIPYEINVPFWSDGAVKSRWISVPNGSDGITFRADSSWTFPAGTVLIKHFELPVSEDSMVRLETRFFIIDDENKGYGLTYKWNDEGTDAVLIGENENVSDEIEVYENGIQSTQTWNYPLRSRCIECHNSNAGFVLGPRTQQLNKPKIDESTGVNENQLITWNQYGFFSNMDNDIDLFSLPKVAPISDTTASLQHRIRSYLDVNCSYCHQPGGVEALFDARITTPLHDQNIINESVISYNSITGNKIIYPFHADSSEIWLRSSSVGYNRMPPLAKNKVDEEYLEVLKEWIENFKYTAEETISLCEGESYTFPDGETLSNIDSSMVYESQFIAQDGLDSVISTFIEVTNIDQTITINDVTQLTANESDEGTTFQWIDCSNGNAIVEGATHQSFSSNQEGSYAVMITKNGCTVTSECVTITGVIENNLGAELKVYPNPTSGKMNLEFGRQIIEGTIHITDLTGKTIFNATLQNQNTKTLYLDCERGLYLMTITDYKNRKAIIRFLKE